MKNKKIITICCSASFYKNALEISEKLKKMGFKVKMPHIANVMKKRKNFNVADYKTWFKNKKDYKIKTKLMKNHFRKVVEGDVILVVNNKKNNVEGYIGANTLMEMAIAFYNKKPIYIFNNISDDFIFKEEIFGLNPIFLNGDLNKIKR